MEEQQPAEVDSPSLVNHAIKHGVIIGIVTVMLCVIIYAIDYSFMAGFKFLGLLLVIGLGYVIYAGINYRTEVGGYLPYGKAFVHGLSVLAVSGFISTIFQIVLYHVVDTELAEKMTEVIMRNTEEMMANFGAPQDSIDQTIEGMRADMASQFSIGGQLFSYVKALIFYAIIALITSLFVRRNVPTEV